MKKIVHGIYKYMFFSVFRTRYKVRFLLFLKKKNRLKPIRFILSNHIESRYHILIGTNAIVGNNLLLPHPHNVVIGNSATIGDNCTIYHDVTLGKNHDAFPIVGDNVVIYTGAKILGGVTIGNNAVIGANAVVTADVPENAIVAGVPAKIIRYREEYDEFT